MIRTSAQIRQSVQHLPAGWRICKKRWELVEN